MEDLVRSLRSLGLRPPSSALLVDLLDADADPDAQKRLADLLSLEKLTSNRAEDDKDGGDDDDDDDDADLFITPDVVRGALLSLLDSFSRTLARARELHKREYAAYVASRSTQTSGSGSAKGGGKALKPVPRAALLNRQSSDIRRAQEEYEALLRGKCGPGENSTPQPIPRLILEGAPFFTSSTPLEQLERMGIAEFQAPRHFQGRYLLCRVISVPLVYVGATFIVEDPSGAATPLSIAHFTSRLNLAPDSAYLASLLPLGTVLAIREPYVSSNHHVSAGGPIHGKAATGVRVSSPTDVIVLEEDDERLKDVQWKVALAESSGGPRRHRWMSEGLCAHLARSSSESAGHQVPSAAATRALLAELLEERRPGAAYRELVAARKLGVLPGAGQDQETVNIEAQILHQLRSYEGLQRLQDSCKATGLQIPQPQADVLLNAPKHRRTDPNHQGEPSQTLVEALYTLDRNPTDPKPIPELYGQDFVSPAIHIAPIPGAGRGLLTTRDVAPGELLLCCNAVEPCFAEDEHWAGVQVLRLGLSVEHANDAGIVGAGAEGVSVTTTQVMACTRLVHALVDRPELCHAVLGLTAGPHTPDSSFAQQDTYPLIISAILDPAQALDRYSRPDVDAKYIDGVLQHNAFGPGRDVDVDLTVPVPSPDSLPEGEAASTSPRRRYQRAPPAGADLARASMPHPLPAILNHRCVPNVSSVFLGSCILTRALVPLPRGTEIVHQYVSGERPFFIRSAHLSKHGFECTCVLCVLERAEGREVVRRRVEIREGRMGSVLERARMLDKQHRAGLMSDSDEDAEADLGRAFRQIYEDIEATYSPQRGSLGDVAQVVLKPELFDALVMLARHYRREDSAWWESIQCELKALRCVGALIDNDWLAEHFDPALLSQPSPQAELLLKQAPVLRLVDSQRVLLRISRTLRARYPNEPSAAIRWVDAAYALSTWMIGGGSSVFLDMMHRARAGDEWELPDGGHAAGTPEMADEASILAEWAARTSS